VPALAGGVALSSPTIRMVTRISIGGDTIRVRFSNAHATGKLQIGAAHATGKRQIGASHVALRSQGTGIVPGTGRKLTFTGSAAATIPTAAAVRPGGHPGSCR
jgi:hypothetical protein